MAHKVFQVRNQKLIEFKQVSGKKAEETEKMIQTMIEKNISVLFPSLEFMTSEYSIDNLRPDSIVFDNDRKSFVIIEYKNVKHKGVVDQGMSYYKLLQEKKENFILLYHKIRGGVLDPENDVNWDEARVIFISPQFTEHQKRASQSVSLPIELYEITKFDDGIFTLDRIENENNETRQTKPKSTSLIRLDEYSEDDYLEGKYDPNLKPEANVKSLFFTMKYTILSSLPEVESKQKKKYMGFYSKNDGSAICTIEATRNKLKLCYAISKVNVLPTSSFVRHMVENGKKIGHWGIGDFMSEIKDQSDIVKAMPLIQKVYEFKIK
jgi:predicted transport protein